MTHLFSNTQSFGYKFTIVGFRFDPTAHSADNYFFCWTRVVKEIEDEYLSSSVSAESRIYG